MKDRFPVDDVQPEKSWVELDEDKHRKEFKSNFQKMWERMWDQYFKYLSERNVK